MTLPYKYRGIVLLAGLAVALPWMAWHFALHDTFTAWSDCRRLAAQLETLALMAAQPAATHAGDRELILSARHGAARRRATCRAGRGL